MIRIYYQLTFTFKIESGYAVVAIGIVVVNFIIYSRGVQAGISVFTKTRLIYWGIPCTRLSN